MITTEVFVDTIAIPERMRTIIRTIFALRSFRKEAAFCPVNNPAAINGVTSAAFFSTVDVNNPRIRYITTRTTFSARKIAQMLPLKELISSVVMLT